MSRNHSYIVWLLPLILLAGYVPLAVAFGALPMTQSQALETLRLSPPSDAGVTLAQTAYLIVFAAIGILSYMRFGWLAAAIFLSAAVGGDVVACRYLSTQVGVGATTFGLYLVWSGAGLGQILSIVQTRRRIRTLFDGRLANTAIGEILRYPDLIRLESETRTMSGLSCRLIIPDGLLEGDAQNTTDAVSLALKTLTGEALKAGGTIDAVSARGFTAFWNAPLPDPDHARNACTAAVAMQKAIGAFNRAQAARTDTKSHAPLEIALGVATGPATAGRIDTDRPAYSVGGLMLEIAVRLQQIAARYGACALVSETTQVAAAADFAFLEVDYRVMEPNGPVRLFALQGTGVRTSPRFKAQATFHTHLFAAIRNQQWKKARDLLERCRSLSGACAALYDLHQARIAFYERNPPGEAWDGAYRPPMH